MSRFGYKKQINQGAQHKRPVSYQQREKVLKRYQPKILLTVLFSIGSFFGNMWNHFFPRMEKLERDYTSHVDPSDIVHKTTTVIDFSPYAKRQRDRKRARKGHSEVVGSYRRASKDTPTSSTDHLFNYVPNIPYLQLQQKIKHAEFINDNPY